MLAVHIPLCATGNCVECSVHTSILRLHELDGQGDNSWQMLGQVRAQNEDLATAETLKCVSAAELG